MAEHQKIEDLKKSIGEWTAKLESGSATFPESVIQDIIKKLEADLAAEENA